MRLHLFFLCLFRPFDIGDMGEGHATFEEDWDISFDLLLRNEIGRDWLPSLQILFVCSLHREYMKECKKISENFFHDRSVMIAETEMFHGLYSKIHCFGKILKKTCMEDFLWNVPGLSFVNHGFPNFFGVVEEMPDFDVKALCSHILSKNVMSVFF